VDRERGVIIEEINMRHDDPRQHVANVYEELLYGDQPLGWEIAGQKDTILAMPRDKFVEYFNSHYFARNTVIAIGGKFDEENIEDKVSKYFSDVRQAEILKAPAVTESQEKPAIQIFNKSTDQSHFLLGNRAFGRFDERRWAMQLLQVILGGGMSSRLFTEVREKRGLGYYVYAAAEMYADAGSFAAAAGIDNKRLQDSIKVILDEFGKISSQPVSDAELAKAKSYIRGKTAISLETSDSLADFYGEQVLLREEIMTVEDSLDRLDAVTSDEIMAVAKDIFTKESLNLAIVGPMEKEKDSLYELLKL